MKFEEKELTRIKEYETSHSKTASKGFYDTEDQLHFLEVVLIMQRFVRKWLIRKKRRLPLKADKARKL